MEAVAHEPFFARSPADVFASVLIEEAKPWTNGGSANENRPPGARTWISGYIHGGDPALSSVHTVLAHTTMQVGRRRNPSVKRATNGPKAWSS